MEPPYGSMNGKCKSLHFFSSFCSTQRILKKKGENYHPDEAPLVSALQLAVSPAALFTHHHIQKRPDLSHVPFHQSWGSLPRVTGQPRQTAPALVFKSDSTAEESGFIGISQRLNGTPGLLSLFHPVQTLPGGG